jgi:xanthine dehydrogenase accessory factor
MPVALDVGRVSTREIAVGVLAELVRPRAGGELVRGVWPARPEVAEVIDPVCGVTVVVGSARHKVDHKGVTCHFCCPGWARAFEKDPLHSWVGDEVVHRMFGPRVLKESE